MNRIDKYLRDEVGDCFMDWSGDFNVDLEIEDVDEGVHYYSLILTHKQIGPKEGYNFSVKSDGEKAEIEIYEDTWESIDKESMFCLLWFTEAKTR